MQLSFALFDREDDELVAFLTGEEWPYHGTARVSEQWVRDGLAGGRFTGEHVRTFWMLHDGKRIGLLRVFDLPDPTPMFDIRISAEYRGRGFGEQALRWLSDYIFGEYEDKLRLEGHTRIDNYAMRKTFHKAGFVKEAVHRKSWPSYDGVVYDSVGYSIIREDWEQRKTTPIVWDDLPF